MLSGFHIVLRCAYVKYCDGFFLVGVVYVVGFATSGVEGVVIENDVLGIDGSTCFAFGVVETVDNAVIWFVVIVVRLSRVVYFPTVF